MSMQAANCGLWALCKALWIDNTLFTNLGLYGNFLCTSLYAPLLLSRVP